VSLSDSKDFGCHVENDGPIGFVEASSCVIKSYPSAVCWASIHKEHSCPTRQKGSDQLLVQQIKYNDERAPPQQGGGFVGVWCVSISFYIYVYIILYI
jgi:hypothetical protein